MGYIEVLYDMYLGERLNITGLREYISLLRKENIDQKLKINELNNRIIDMKKVKENGKKEK